MTHAIQAWLQTRKELEHVRKYDAQGTGMREALAQLSGRLLRHDRREPIEGRRPVRDLHARRRLRIRVRHGRVPAARRRASAVVVRQLDDYLRRGCRWLGRRD